MSQYRYNADMNVKISVGYYAGDTFQIRYEKEFKNTGTRLLTDSIARFIAGDENTYIRGSGRPNFLGFGTRGIQYQGDLHITGEGGTHPQVLEPDYDDKNPPEEHRTRPWYNSDSLGGTTIDDNSPGSFWDNQYGWGTASDPNHPVFQGELCTAHYNQNIETGTEEVFTLQRAPILSTTINSDCPNDEDYGQEGYKSSIIFRGSSTSDWLNKLLNPENGPVLTQIAISEVGLYEKNNTDPHGLRTMLAGFRIPSEDIIYLQKDESVFVEWTITVQAIMPNEQVKTEIDRKALGIQINAESPEINQVNFSAVVLGTGNPRQDVEWSIENELSESTMITPEGTLFVSLDENTDHIQVNAVSIENRTISANPVVFLQLKNNYPFAVSAYGVPVDYLHVSYISTVLGKGVYSENVIWSLVGKESPNTTVSTSGRVTIDLAETADNIDVVATSDVDPEVLGTSKITLLAHLLNFESYPITIANLSGQTVARLAVHSLRSSTSGVVRMSMRVVPNSSGSITISLRNFRTMVASYTREVTQGQSQDIVIDTPTVITSAKHQLSIIVAGDVTVPTVSSFVYGSFLEEVEWYDTTSDSSYLIEQTDDGTKSNVLYYIDNKINITVPDEIDNGDTTILRATSFNYSDVEMVQLPDTLTRIE